MAERLILPPGADEVAMTLALVTAAVEGARSIRGQAGEPSAGPDESVRG